MDELRKLVKEFFAGDIMQWVGSDHHKQQDGTLEITYSYYYDDCCQDKIIAGWYHAWLVCHPGYVRERIEGRADTLKGAVASFRKDWEEKKKEWKNGFKEFHTGKALPDATFKADIEAWPGTECPEVALHIKE